MSSVHGLQEQGANVLHHPHQARGGAGPGTRFITQLPVNNPVYGDVNTIYLPPLPIVVSDMYLAVTTGALGGPTTPYFIPTINWFRSIVLLKQRGTLITLPEAELVAEHYKNPHNYQDLIARMDMINEVGATLAATRATGTFTYYVSLRRLVQGVFGKCGPLNAYAAQTWSIDFNMLAGNQITAGATSTAVTGGTISSMKLVLIGHKESTVNTDAVQAKLEDPDGGINIKIEQSNHRRFTYGASATTPVISLPEMQGEVTQIDILQRVKASWDSIVPNAMNKLDWQYFENRLDTISIGTTASPFILFGQPISQRDLRLAQVGDGLNGKMVLIDATGARAQVGLISISMEEAPSLGLSEGVFSGVLRISHDLQISFSFTTTTTENYVDVIVYIRRSILLNESGWAVINEE